MSVYGALYSGVSGLAANSNALGMISDNITNVNTVGYKASKASFSTLVTGGSQSVYSPGGVRAHPQTLVNQAGLLQASDSETDLGISGNGFFIVSANPENDVSNSNISFTRAGSFFPDDQGYLRNTAGLYLKGWPIDAEGNIPSNLGDLSTLDTVRTSGLTGTAEATTRVSLRANLQSSQESYTGAYTPGDMTDGTVTPQFVRDIEIYDAQGGAHTVTMSWLKSGDNQWEVEMHTDEGSGPTLVASGTMMFNEDGSWDEGNTSAELKDPVDFTWSNGASPNTVSFNWGRDGEDNGVTQKDSSSTVISKSINGAVFGNVTGVEIGEDGIVTALFDNGLQKEVYQLPIATFQNPNGLKRQPGNAYTQSDYSGSFNMQVAGSGGAGTISPSTLEASTVDLAAEFSELITTQRAYSASTKVITTADEMLDELTRLKR